MSTKIVYFGIASKKTQGGDIQGPDSGTAQPATLQTL